VTPEPTQALPAGPTPWRPWATGVELLGLGLLLVGFASRKIADGPAWADIVAASGAALCGGVAITRFVTTFDHPTRHRFPWNRTDGVMFFVALPTSRGGQSDKERSDQVFRWSIHSLTRMSASQSPARAT
jgi:hypothetical protein